MSDYIDVEAVDSLEEGEALVVPEEQTGTGTPIAIFHAEDGEFYALDDTCTHETASLADGWIEGTEVECPVHSAKFCLKTGNALCMPASIPARTHAVQVREGRILLKPSVAADGV